MTKASDNEFPSVLFGELGAAPTTPATGKWRVYTKSTGLFIVDDAGAETGPFGTGGGSGAGEELDYAQATSGVTVSGTSEATATTLVTGNAVAYDGSPVYLEFHAPYTDSTTIIRFYIYDGSGSVGEMGLLKNSAGNYSTVNQSYRFTPSAATHTYGVRAAVASGTSLVDAGAGGNGALCPLFMRITKV